MCRIVPIDQDAARRIPIRAAVLDLLALAAPLPAALGAPDPEEREFLETLRRIVARAAAEELRDADHAVSAASASRALARFGA